MKKYIVLLAIPLFLVSCKKMVDVELPVEAPKAKSTSYTDALTKFGRLTKLFRVGKVNVQTTGVMDDTGTAQATGGEIPFDITEMIKSSVNRIGGSIVFIPYDPVYLKNQASLQFTTLEGKAKPDVLVQGGITEFDRALESGSQGFDAGGSFGGGSNAPSAEFGTQDRDSTSSITLDLNMVDFETMAMVPRMQAVNSIKVFKAASDMEIGFSLFGATFGFKGSVKKIQGRHAAVRVLVEMSILEILGKYLNLPYWKCLPEGDARPDPVVLENIKDQYFEAGPDQKVRMIQNLLAVYGFRNVRPSGELDGDTVQAIRSFESSYGVSAQNLDENFYEQLFLNVPVLGEQSRVSLAAAPASAGGLSMPQVGAAPYQAPAAPAAGPLSVKVWTDKKEYRQGEKIFISLQGNRDFYGKIVYLTASGEVIQLLPNDLRTLNFFKSGRVYRIPDTGDAFNLEVTPPFGSEQIVVYASESPLAKVRTRSIGQGLTMFEGSKNEYGQRVRGIKIAAPSGGSVAPQDAKATAPAPGVEVFETSCTLRTTP